MHLKLRLFNSLRSNAQNFECVVHLIEGGGGDGDYYILSTQANFITYVFRSYYHQAHACILVFDATRKVTYKNLANWYTELRQENTQIFF